jgi:hypothetical protein
VSSVINFTGTLLGDFCLQPRHWILGCVQCGMRRWHLFSNKPFELRMCVHCDGHAVQVRKCSFLQPNRVQVDFSWDHHEEYLQENNQPRSRILASGRREGCHTFNQDMEFICRGLLLLGGMAIIYVVLPSTACILYRPN